MAFRKTLGNHRIGMNVKKVFRSDGNSMCDRVTHGNETRDQGGSCFVIGGLILLDDNIKAFSQDQRHEHGGI